MIIPVTSRGRCQATTWLRMYDAEEHWLDWALLRQCTVAAKLISSSVSRIPGQAARSCWIGHSTDAFQPRRRSLSAGYWFGTISRHLAAAASSDSGSSSRPCFSKPPTSPGKTSPASFFGVLPVYPTYTTGRSSPPRTACIKRLVPDQQQPTISTRAQIPRHAARPPRAVRQLPPSCPNARPPVPGHQLARSRRRARKGWDRQRSLGASRPPAAELPSASCRWPGRPGASAPITHEYQRLAHASHLASGRKDVEQHDQPHTRDEPALVKVCASALQAVWDGRPARGVLACLARDCRCPWLGRSPEDIARLARGSAGCLAGRRSAGG